MPLTFHLRVLVVGRILKSPSEKSARVPAAGVGGGGGDHKAMRALHAEFQTGTKRATMEKDCPRHPRGPH